MTTTVPPHAELLADCRIAILGGGTIGEALIAGLRNAGIAGNHIQVTNRTAERRAELARSYGVEVSADNRAAVAQADVVFVCVKPYAVRPLLSDISTALPPQAAVVSLAAGLSLASLAAPLADDTAVLRVMPNTPMLVGAGMSTLAASPQVTDRQRALVTAALAAVGEVMELPEEKMDAATAVAGSAPAYFFLFAEALIDAAVEQGLSRDQAQRLVAQTMVGSGTLLVERGTDPVPLRAAVTSPGGTTAAALREFEESGLRGATYRAVERCIARARSLD